MGDEGFSLSLDDYIKKQKKQGGFKGGRVSVKTRPQQRGRVRGAAGRGRGKINKGQQPAINQQQPRNRQAKGRGGRAGGNRFKNNIAVQGQNSRQSNQKRIRGTQNRLNSSRRGRGQRQFAAGRNAFQGQQRLGISQHLVRGNIRNRQNQIAPLISRNRSRLPAFNVQRGRVVANAFRTNNRRATLKFTQKRVQRARLQLATTRPLVGLRTGRRSVIAPIRSLLTSNSGVRRSRNGFVTVTSPAVKQIERLFIQEKIQKARNARNNVGRNSNQMSNAYRRNNNAVRTQIVNNNPRRYIPNVSSRAAAAYDPYEPAMMPRSMTMYSDQAPQSSRGMASRAQWSPPMTITRTTTNNQYRNNNSRPADEYDNQGLNAEIQRKISFIQSRTRSVDPPGILQDFRAPISSSTIKLGDRFRMYMQ